MENLELKYSSSIENIDIALFEWLDRDLNLHCNTKDGFTKVNCLWVTPERAFQIKNNKEIRDENGTLNLPLITLERTSISKDQKDAGNFYANIPPKNNRFWSSQRIYQKKTSEYAKVDSEKKYGINFVSPKKNQKIVYKFYSTLLPVYAYFTYNINIFTQFQEQMNEIVQPFIVKGGSQRYFLIKKNSYSYECFIEKNIDLKNNINSLEEEERRYVTNITIKVLGVLTGGGENENDSFIKEYENPVEIKFPKDNNMIYTGNAISSVVRERKTGLLINSENTKKLSFIIGDGINSSFSIQHNLNNDDLIVGIKENFGNFRAVNAEIIYISKDEILINMNNIPQVNGYLVTIVN